MCSCVCVDVCATKGGWERGVVDAVVVVVVVYGVWVRVCTSLRKGRVCVCVWCVGACVY